MKDGGSAFPSQQLETSEGTWNQTYDPGMSLRDWFAGQALGAAWTSMNIAQGIGEATFKSNVAIHAYAMADAMLKARERADG